MGQKKFDVAIGQTEYMVHMEFTRKFSIGLLNRVLKMFETKKKNNFKSYFCLFLCLDSNTHDNSRTKKR